MKKINGQYRQGDVLVDYNQRIDREAVKQIGGRVILAHGEVTGHAHEIDIDDGEAWKIGEETVGITIKKSTAIRHQEHSPIPVKKGRPVVRRQSEYSPLAIRSVAD